MKYTCEIVIDKPRDEVIKLFDIKYDFGKRKMELIETITFRNLPDEFHGNYQTKGVVNIQKNYFKDEGQKTKWISETEFKFSGFMKLMAFFMGKSPFKKQTMSFMEDFKAFAEGNPKY